MVGDLRRLTEDWQAFVGVSRQREKKAGEKLKEINETMVERGRECS